jgi:hypothetical protein
VQYETQSRKESEGFAVPYLAVAHEMVPGMESIPGRISPETEIAHLVLSVVREASPITDYMVVMAF